MIPLVLSPSKRDKLTLRQAQGERSGTYPEGVGLCVRKEAAVYAAELMGCGTEAAANA